MSQNLYLIRNYTLKEALFGITGERIRDEFKRLRSGSAVHLEHWDWQIQEIECDALVRTKIGFWARYQGYKRSRQFKRRHPGWRVYKTDHGGNHVHNL